VADARVIYVKGMSSAVPGAMINSNVRLVRELGAGGMGSVWLAEHLALQAPVVVKFMANALASEADYVARFSREAAAASQVRSPHVVQMLDHGVTADGIPYIVMEYLEGHDLGRQLANKGRLTVPEISPIILQVCKALTQAHKRGIVHRDIKPENIFLCDQGEEFFVKLLDFGIARSETAAGSTATATGTVMGSPPYMSPEQLVGSKTIDHRTDLWAIGVVVFEALTGRRPFEADTIGALAIQVHTAEFPRPTSVVPTLPPGIDDWFARACARKAEDRFSSAKEMSDALLAVEGAVAPHTMRLMVPEVDQFGETSMMPQLRPGEITAPPGHPGTYTAPGLGPKVHGRVASDPTMVAGRVDSSVQPSPASAAATVPRKVQTSSSAFAVSAPHDAVDSVMTVPRSKAPTIALVAVLLLVLGGGGFFAWSRLRGDTDEGKKTAASSSTTASETTSTAPVASETAAPAAKPKRAFVKVVLPPGAILKVGPNDWTSKISKDGKLELTGPENSAFRIAIYQGKKQLVSQTHVLYDDDVVDPPDIDPGKGEQMTTKPLPTAKPLGTSATTAPTVTSKPTGTAPGETPTVKKGPKVEEKPE